MSKYRNLTKDFLESIFSYDEKLGVLRWINSPSRNVKAGESAGCLNPDGYLYVKITGGIYAVHRLVFIMVNGYNPENDIDHVNRNKSDNRPENIREVTRSCNNRNRSMMKSNTSGVTGVFWCKKKKRWKSSIKINGKIKYLGLHIDIVSAACARLAAEQCLGFEHCKTDSSAFRFISMINDVSSTQATGIPTFVEG